VYATDFKCFTLDQIEAWKSKVHTMVASGIYFGEHRSHSVIPETLQLFDDLEVKQGWITHLAHTVDFDKVSGQLPISRNLCYDGLEIERR
jgi:phosphoribosyl 1,2-cyclic phosphate phosphodiesterase